MRNKRHGRFLADMLTSARYEVLPTGTIEDKVLALQERKRDLFEKVVDDGGALSGAITSADIRALLGAEGLQPVSPHLIRARLITHLITDAILLVLVIGAVLLALRLDEAEVRRHDALRDVVDPEPRVRALERVRGPQRGLRVGVRVLEELRRPHERVDQRPHKREDQRRDDGAGDEQRVVDAVARVTEDPVDEREIEADQAKAEQAGGDGE